MVYSIWGIFIWKVTENPYSFYQQELTQWCGGKSSHTVIVLWAETEVPGLAVPGEEATAPFPLIRQGMCALASKMKTHSKAWTNDLQLKF